MKLEFGLDQTTKDDTSLVTVGTFDGVHLGHQAILQYLRQRAHDRGGSSVALSFHPHPREVIYGDKIPLLSSIEERADLLEKLGLDRFIVLPFTKAFAHMSAEDFVEKILVGRIGMQEIVIGYDFSFGHGRRGNSKMLHELGKVYGFYVDIIPAQIVERYVVSSTEIRGMITSSGDVNMASHLLGRPYSACGRVVHGTGRGHTIGYPTANIEIDPPQKVVPREGVYAVVVRIDGHASKYGGMMNIGKRPTFGGNDIHLEVHLFGFEGDLYGNMLCLEFVERIRDEQRFNSPERLVEQLSRDQGRCIRRLKEYL